MVMVFLNRVIEIYTGGTMAVLIGSLIYFINMVGIRGFVFR